MLYLHPFGEEMNKSRRTAALAARSFAADGWAILQIDMRGCGDSIGEFIDATWESWLNDANLGINWLRERYGRIDIVWGLRLGALLACDVASRIDRCDLLLWQPVLSGNQHLTQFLRLKAAAEMLNPDGARGGTKALRDALNQGRHVEIAGYQLAPALALPMDEARLRLPPSYRGRVFWFEVSPDDASTLAPSSVQFIETARAAGVSIESQCVQGPPFWQSVEVEEAPLLISKSQAALSGNARAYA